MNQDAFEKLCRTVNEKRAIEPDDVAVWLKDEKKHVRFSGVSEMNGNATVSLNGWINGSLTRKLNVMRRTNEAHNRSCADSVPLILLPPGWAAHWTLYLGLRPGAVKKASGGKEKGPR